MFAEMEERHLVQLKCCWNDSTRQDRLQRPRSVSLLIPNEIKMPFPRKTDASEKCSDAIMSQQHKNGHEYPVAYWSRKLLAHVLVCEAVC